MPSKYMLKFLCIVLSDNNIKLSKKQDYTEIFIYHEKKTAVIF